MTSIGEDFYRLSEGVLSVPADGESLLLAIESDKYFGVRGAMRHLLEPLRDGLTLNAMVADLCERYEVTSEAARRDLEAILPRLLAAGIIQKS